LLPAGPRATRSPGRSSLPGSQRRLLHKVKSAVVRSAIHRLALTWRQIPLKTCLRPVPAALGNAGRGQLEIDPPACRYLPHHSCPGSDRARRAARGASDRGDRTGDAARHLLGLSRRGERRRVAALAPPEVRARLLVSDGRAAGRRLVRLPGEALRTPSRAHRVGSTKPVLARGSRYSGSSPLSGTLADPEGASGRRRPVGSRSVRHLVDAHGAAGTG
jgi:hypothetical protein